MGFIEGRTNFLIPGEIDNHWSRWKGLYESLRREGRIWEVRDIVSASIGALGAQKTWNDFFGVDIYSGDFFDRFLDDWTLDGYDESTVLAVLDILICLSRSFVIQISISKEKPFISTAKRCLGHARTFAAAIRQNNPENIKSRPYIRWILAEEELTRHIEEIDKEHGSKGPSSCRAYFDKFPGLTLWHSGLPIYIPMRAENPGWYISKVPEKSNELLKVALKASQELGDYATESLCLKELLYRSPEPDGLFAQLAILQRSVQGDELGYLETCLSKYLLAGDEKSGQALKIELNVSDGGRVTSKFINDPLALWCQRMVQNGLFRFLGTFPTESGLKNVSPERLFNDLPLRIQKEISERNLASNKWKNPNVDSQDIPKSSTKPNQELMGVKGKGEPQALGFWNASKFDTFESEDENPSPSPSRAGSAKSDHLHTQADCKGKPEQMQDDDLAWQKGANKRDASMEPDKIIYHEHRDKDGKIVTIIERRRRYSKTGLTGQVDAKAELRRKQDHEIGRQEDTAKRDAPLDESEVVEHRVAQRLEVEDKNGRVIVYERRSPPRRPKSNEPDTKRSRSSQASSSSQTWSDADEPEVANHKVDCKKGQVVSVGKSDDYLGNRSAREVLSAKRSNMTGKSGQNGVIKDQSDKEASSGKTTQEHYPEEARLPTSELEKGRGRNFVTGPEGEKDLKPRRSDCEYKESSDKRMELTPSTIAFKAARVDSDEDSPISVEEVE
jgi:hypothetical protein